MTILKKVCAVSLLINAMFITFNFASFKVLFGLLRFFEPVVISCVVVFLSSVIYKLNSMIFTPEVIVPVPVPVPYIGFPFWRLV